LEIPLLPAGRSEVNHSHLSQGDGNRCQE